MKERIIIGISGASGAPIAVSLLRTFRETPFETHLIITEGGRQTLLHETQISQQELAALADVVYDNADIAAAPASGSFKTVGMIVAPCSMKTLAGINSGYSDSLLLRAADVTLKERRKLALVTRETPLSAIHLRNMYELSRIGAILLPAMLSYYNHPQSVKDMTNHMVGKILDVFGIDFSEFKRWEG